MVLGVVQPLSRETCNTSCGMLDHMLLIQVLVRLGVVDRTGVGFEISSTINRPCYPALPLSLPRITAGRPSLIQLRRESPDELPQTPTRNVRPGASPVRAASSETSDPKMNFGATKPHVIELEEARAEWRRRHPPNKTARITRLPDL